MIANDKFGSDVALRKLRDGAGTAISRAVFVSFVMDLLR